MPRYKTLAELVAARAAGAIPPLATMYIDNDNISMYDEEADVELFEMHPDDLIEEALTLFGIPHESV